MNKYVKSNPLFFRMILISMTLCFMMLLIAAYLAPAPLQEQGTIAIVPNPVKSAWFLLWIQELVGYDKRWIYLVAVFTLCFLMLPWVSRYRSEYAAWLRKGNRCVGWASLILFIFIITLTVIAMFFRGANWAFVMPF